MANNTVAGSITDISEVCSSSTVSAVQVCEHKTDYEKQYIQALQTATYAANYERSSRIVESVTKEEEIRKLNCQIFLLQDEIETLNDQLESEEDNVDDLEERLIDEQYRADDRDNEAYRLSNELRIMTREVQITKVG
jgi:predicted  nucleic acid-binding Zn-ribbon protein